MKKKILTTAIITGLTALIGLGAFLSTKVATKQAKADNTTLPAFTMYPNDVNDTFLQALDNLVGHATNTTRLYYPCSINASVGSSIRTYSYISVVKTSGNSENITANNPQFDIWLTIGQASASTMTRYTYMRRSDTGAINFNCYYGTGSSAQSFGYFSLPIEQTANDITTIYYARYLELNPSQEGGEGGEGGDTPTPITPPADSYTFTFAYQINYYAPYGQNIDSMFVSDSDMDTNGETKTITIFEGQTFQSGGQEFDTIKLRYYNAIAYSYKDSSGTRQVWGTHGFANYAYMEYWNTDTNHIEIVNNRLTSPYQKDSTTGVDQERGSLWVSSTYQILKFTVPLTEIQQTDLGKLNNANLYGNTYEVGNDIGLGSAFTLLGSAFTSWTGILSVQVLPNISLGLLIFLPMIVGIIILIIWLVKR